jgi:hypothetical protein
MADGRLVRQSTPDIGSFPFSYISLDKSPRKAFLLKGSELIGFMEEAGSYFLGQGAIEQQTGEAEMGTDFVISLFCFCSLRSDSLSTNYITRCPGM